MSRTARRHFEDSISISASPQEIFNFTDDYSRLSTHMSQSSAMMGGGRMAVLVDSGRGQRVGSHIRLSGKAFGITVFLEEVVTFYEPPYRKEWETVGEPKLIVIGHYRMGFEINKEGGSSKLKVFIDYELPSSSSTRWLGYLFGKTYAKWCVEQMLQDAQKHFANHGKNLI